MSVPWHLIDLGTKKGGAIDVFRRHHGMYFPRQGIVPRLCLGVDRNPAYQAPVHAKGYAFRQADAMDFDYPVADFYTAFDFLEHLPDVAASDEVLRRMLAAARKGVWLRMPSFETDETGGGQLARLGLRFDWTAWDFHTSHYTLADVRRVISDRFVMRTKGNLRFADTKDRRIEAMPGFAKPNPPARLDPPVIGQWEVLLTPAR